MVPEAEEAIVFTLHKAYLLIIILYTVFKIPNCLVLHVLEE